MQTIVVSGALANKPFNGGEAWVRLSWIRSLQRLGFNVRFVEQISPKVCGETFETSDHLAYFKNVTDAFGLTKQATLLYDDGRQSYGSSLNELLDVADESAMLINISGHLAVDRLLRRFRRRAYIDIDPGYTQAWAESGIARLEGHDLYFTIAENIGRPECSIPGGGVEWRVVRQPVVLDDWPVCASDHASLRFTTIASWRGAFGPVELRGKICGLKAHEFRKFMELPRRASDACFELALSIHPADSQDLHALREHGWQTIDPRAVAGTPGDFRNYVQGSAAEFSVAQGIYVQTNSGWFSDRTTRYLASGRPAVVQETGFTRNIPAGTGLIAFNTISEAVEGVARIAQDYAEQAQAARHLAQMYFAPDVVLPPMIEQVMRI